MPIKVSCNSCGGVLHAPDDSAGKRGRCPTCGTILSIPADAPRVAAEAMPAPPPAFGSPASAEAPTFPRVPGFGGDGPPPPGQRSSTAPMPAMANRLPPDPRRHGDPFAKTGKPAQVAAADKAMKRWRRINAGLGLVRTGVVLLALGVLIPAGVIIAEQNGVALPVKDPGLFGVKNLTLADEIKFGGTVAFFLIGGLFVVLGRVRFAGVSSETGARGGSVASAFATILAYTGFAVIVAFVVSATLAQVPPRLILRDDALAEKMKFQQRVEDYVRQVFLPTNESFGQAQRYGTVALLAGSLLAEVWFFGALGRLAAFLRSDRAVGRVNRLTVAAGMLVLIAVFAWLTYDLFGRDWVNQNLVPQWNGLTVGAKISTRAGAFALVAVVLAVMYTRSLRGVRMAIRDANASN